MSLLCSILLFALTRNEIIARFRIAPITKLDGLVQVFADCPEDMRREFHLPVAGYVADICRSLYGAHPDRRRHFQEPGIIVSVGDERTNNAAIAVSEKIRPGGEYCTRLKILSPGYADMEKLRIETAKAFYLAVMGERIGDDEALTRLRRANPETCLADKYAAIGRWMNGEKVDASDEEMLKLARSVLQPGVAYPQDILRFASRLCLYPETFSAPFCGKYRYLDYRSAVKLAKIDGRIRFIAYMKIPEIIAYGGGRGELMSEASTLYAAFLRELAAGKMQERELTEILDQADLKLNLAMEEARLRAEGKLK